MANATCFLTCWLGGLFHSVLVADFDNSGDMVVVVVVVVVVIVVFVFVVVVVITVVVAI